MWLAFSGTASATKARVGVSRTPVREALQRWADLPLSLLCDRLLAELLGDGVEDDVAVLAVRAHSVHAERPDEAGP